MVLFPVVAMKQSQPVSLIRISQLMRKTLTNLIEIDELDTRTRCSAATLHTRQCTLSDVSRHRPPCDVGDLELGGVTAARGTGEGSALRYVCN